MKVVGKTSIWSNAASPTRYDLGLPADREAARDDPELELGLTHPDPVGALPRAA